MNGIVYGLLDPRDHALRYVGVTTGPPKRRLDQHLTAGRRGERLPVAKWVGKLLTLEMRPSMVILSRFSGKEDPYDAEVELIARYRAAGMRLLNVTPGGRGGGVGPKSSEHRARISASNKGRKHPERSAEWRAAHAAKLRGRPRSAETKEKIREAHARRRVLVTKVCACGSEFQVIPSRVDRTKYCGPACAAKGRTGKRKTAPDANQGKTNITTGDS